MPVATATYEFAKPHVKKWWKDAVVYQVWPTSFADSNGDGVGDLPGIESKVPYLRSLGVDVLWLSPIFESPQVDMGYDISDYKAINPQFGTVDDVVSLAKNLHDKGMKLLLDLVVNHTSDQAQWFKESRSSKTNPKRDWYIWKPARKNEKGERIPPTNWTAAFGGSTWEWDETTQEYYLHYFCPEQPDLNWENPEVRNAVWDVMHFWLKKGVDGFRMDVINMISKHLDFPDAPIVKPDQFLQPGHEMFFNGPRIHEFLHEMYTEVIQHYDMMNVGEMPGVYDASQMLKYVHQDRQELQMCFDFSLVNLENDHDHFNIPKKWELKQVKDVIAGWSTGLYDGGWWAMYLENHDQCRSISRWTSDQPEFRHAAGKMLALMEMSSFGTTYVYQGQEIGMINLPFDFPLEEYKDVRTINKFREIRERGVNVDALIKNVQSKARDNARSPMQWSAEQNGGFTSGKPWMMLNPDYTKCNVSSQLEDEHSVLSFWKRVIKFRKENEVMTYGKFALLSRLNQDVFSYIRTCQHTSGSGYTRVLVVLNFTSKAVRYEFPIDEHPELKLSDLDKASRLIGTYDDADGSGAETQRIQDDTVELRPFEGLLFKLVA